MKSWKWNPEKNKTLQEERNISFEEILFLVDEGHLLDVLAHPNKEKYDNQKIMVVNVKGYAYLVPFVESSDEIFLKTIIPSRKATRKYLSDEKS